MKSKLISTPPITPVEQPLIFPCLMEQTSHNGVDCIWMATSPREGLLLYHSGTIGLHIKQGIPWLEWLKVPAPNGCIKRRVIPAGEPVTIQFNA